MTHCCRICIKLACKHKGQIEGCSNCVSAVYQMMQDIDKKLNRNYGGSNESI